jgi:hypothetical protein
VIDEAGRSWIRAVCPVHGAMIPLANNPSRCRKCWGRCKLKDVAWVIAAYKLLGIVSDVADVIDINTNAPREGWHEL